MPLNWQISRLYTRKENCKPWNCVTKEILHSSIHGLSTPGLAIIKSPVPIAFLSHPGCTSVPLPIWENLNGTIQQCRKYERCSAQPRQLFLRCLSKWEAVLVIAKAAMRCGFRGCFIGLAFGIPNKYLSFPGNAGSGCIHSVNALNVFLSTLIFRALF